MLAPSGGGLILYQAYGRKAHLLEDKQITSVGVFDERLETASQITRDAVTTLTKTTSQESTTPSEHERPKGIPKDSVSRVQNEKIYNHKKDVTVTASHVIGDTVTKGVVKLLVEVLSRPHIKFLAPLPGNSVDSIDLNGATRNTTRLRLLCFSLCDQAINWLDHLPAGSISTWDDLTTRFLTQFYPPERAAKLRNYILMFLQHQFQIFYDHVDYTTQMAIDYVAGGKLRKLRPEEAWKTIEDLAQYEEEEWNEPESPDCIDATLEQELESMECRVESLMRNEVLLDYEAGFTFPKRAY
ncbi:zinc finger, CCHC-type containing protein [Tanacetum coccineum]